MDPMNIVSCDEMCISCCKSRKAVKFSYANGCHNELVRRYPLSKRSAADLARRLSWLWGKRAQREAVLEELIPATNKRPCEYMS